jgi:hypothetical protein
LRSALLLIDRIRGQLREFRRLGRPTNVLTGALPRLEQDEVLPVWVRRLR